MTEKTSDPTGWPLQREAARILNCDVRTLQRLTSKGQIRATLVDGRKRYDPATIQAYLEDQTTLSPEPMAFVARQLVEIVKSLGNQQKETLSLLVKPTLELHEILCRQNERQEKRISQLEERHIETLAAFEEMMRADHERKLELQRQEANIQLRRQALEQFMPKLNVIIGMVAGKFQQDRDVKAFRELLNDVDPALIDEAHSAGVIDDKQAAIIKKIQARVLNGQNVKTEQEQENHA